MRLALSLIAVLFAVAVAHAQSQRPPSLPPNDNQTQLFRGLLHFHNIQPEAVENIREGYDYSKLIVVVYGDPRSQKVVNICRSALAQGGAVLIAADTEVAVSGYLPRGGPVSVTSTRVFQNDPIEYDGNDPNRPYVRGSAVNGSSPFTDLARVATNGATCVVKTGQPAGLPLEAVAGFAPGAAYTVNGQVIQLPKPLSLPFALATTDDRLPVRCMVLADPDVFSNRLIYTSGREESPTDNLKLANNTVLWLKGRGRTKCLFIENGNPVTKFDEFEFSSIPIGPPMPPIPPIIPPNLLDDPELQRKLADAGNKAIDDAERKDAMNRGILSAFYGRKSTVIAVLACILLGLTYLIIRRRAVANWYRRVFRPIPRDPAMLGPDVPVGSIEHRRLELLRSADYGPVLRPVVWQLFQDRGLPGEYPGDKLPPLDIAVGRPQYLREAIHSLWTVVRSAAPVGYGRWKQLEPLLAAVRAAADDDRWRFVAPSPRDAAS